MNSTLEELEGANGVCRGGWGVRTLHREGEEHRLQKKEKLYNTVAEQEQVEEEKAAEEALFSCLEQSQVCWV